MTGYKPRRPAQLKPDQIDLIEGGADIAYNSELAHAAAQAVVPLPTPQALEPEIVERVKVLIQEEGADAVADFWADSPEDSLPGVLWRGFLLHEWIRRYPQDASERYEAARVYHTQERPEVLELVARPEEVRSAWAEVLRAGFTGDFAEVLRKSARFMDFVGSVKQVWIEDDAHPLATSVTRRDVAMLRTAGEFRHAGELLVKGNLE